MIAVETTFTKYQQTWTYRLPVHDWVAETENKYGSTGCRSATGPLQESLQ
jgi:hypothetical protein